MWSFISVRYVECRFLWHITALDIGYKVKKYRTHFLGWVQGNDLPRVKFFIAYRLLDLFISKFYLGISTIPLVRDLALSPLAFHLFSSARSTLSTSHSQPPSHPSQASSSRQPKQSVTIGGEIAVLSVLSWGPTLIEYLDPVASFRY